MVMFCYDMASLNVFDGFVCFCYIMLYYVILCYIQIFWFSSITVVYIDNITICFVFSAQIWLKLFMETSWTCRYAAIVEAYNVAT